MNYVITGEKFLPGDFLRMGYFRRRGISFPASHAPAWNLIIKIVKTNDRKIVKPDIKKFVDCRYSNRSSHHACRREIKCRI